VRTAPAATADCREKDASKRGTKQAVDDEVTRRVDDNEQVAQLGVVEMKTSTIAVSWLEQRPEDLVEQRRGLTDNEHTDDHNDTECDVVVLATSPTTVHVCRHLTWPDGERPAMDVVERCDKTSIEECQSAEWNNVHDWIVEDVTVNDLIQLTVTQNHRQIGVHSCRVVDRFHHLSAGGNLL